MTLSYRRLLDKVGKWSDYSGLEHGSTTFPRALTSAHSCYKSSLTPTLCLKRPHLQLTFCLFLFSYLSPGFSTCWHWYFSSSRLPPHPIIHTSSCHLSVTLFLIPFKDHLLEERGSLTAHWAPTQSSAPTDWLPFCTIGSRRSGPQICPTVKFRGLFSSMCTTGCPHSSLLLFHLISSWPLSSLAS